MNISRTQRFNSISLAELKSAVTGEVFDNAHQKKSEASMAGASVGLIITFTISLAAQLLGVAMLPLTQGLTRPVPTLIGALGFLIGTGLMARLVNSGVNLSVLIPLNSTAVPLASIAMGVLLFGDTPSVPKLAVLLGACGLIGFATKL
jgi:multidrug transporter EmrE-like cation transporter